jgi:hypothetical protein
MDFTAFVHLFVTPPRPPVHTVELYLISAAICWWRLELLLYQCCHANSKQDFLDSFTIKYGSLHKKR